MHFKLLVNLVLMLFATAVGAGEAARVVFAAGEAKVAGRVAQVGDAVSEGELLATGKDGYLYLKTLDNGFFILRPGSTGQIVAYQVNQEDSAKTRIKLELQNGVARHISGDAVKNARQNFRFNTPVAAIGVRGTDFTVFANQETTHVAVLSGGVVVAPLSGVCSAGGFGPCEGSASRELFANKMGQTLQVGRGQAPVLLQGAEQVPDAVAPPRPDEPANGKAGARSGASGGAVVAARELNLDPLKTNVLHQLNGQQHTSQQQAALAPSVPESAAGPQQLIWGRWQAMLDLPVEVDVNALQGKNKLIATNNYFAIMRNGDASWQRPAEPVIGFSLQQAQAAITDDVSKRVVAAGVENGQLTVDFLRSSFFTKFDLVSQNQRTTLQNSGDVGTDGRLSGGYQFLRPNNMNVQGALANDNKTAAYLFQSRLDDGRLASGALFWGR